MFYQENDVIKMKQKQGLVFIEAKKNEYFIKVWLLIYCMYNFLFNRILFSHVLGYHFIFKK